MTHGHSRGWKCSYCPTSSLVRSNFKFTQDGKPVCVKCDAPPNMTQRMLAAERSERLERGE